MKSLVIGILELSGFLAAQAAVTEAWVHRYNGPANRNDAAKAVAVDRNGNVTVTGFSSNGTNDDFYTRKICGAKWRTALGAAPQRPCK